MYRILHGIKIDEYITKQTAIHYEKKKRKHAIIFWTSTGKESQEEETDTCDLLLYVTLRVLFDIQFIHDRYLHLLHFIAQRSISMRW